MNTTKSVAPAHIFWALAALSLALIPHASRFSAWMLLCFGALAAWRVCGEFSLLPLPTRKHPALWVVKQMLAVAAFVAIYISYQGQLGRDAGVALLTALLGLKMLELNNERDYYVVMFLAYFLVVTNFFYSQTLLTASFMMVIVIVVTGGLIYFNAPQSSHSPQRCIKVAATYVAQAIPLMAIGFFLFPRIPGPLWGIPQGTSAAVTGLTDTMSIGHITELGVSDEIAFRIAFDDQPPPARDLYWRGPVMWHTDGRNWDTGNIGNGVASEVVTGGKRYRYTVTLEPHNEFWLFGIEAVVKAESGIRQTNDFRLLHKRKVKRRLRYTLESQIQFDRRVITEAERRAALSLPRRQHPRTHELARQWREQYPTDRALVEAALTFFNRELFTYTLTPKPLNKDPIDQFLFETREGFCEHYAASFTTLMRAAGIPARVVTGYQGGEFNTVSDYMIVRQRDAHAWTEVYFDDRGWVRIDPTAAVAPERVSLGINNVLPQQSLLPLLGTDSAAFNMFRQASDIWDAVNYNWSQWVLGYTPKRQRQLLDDAGLDDWDYGTLIIVLTLALAVFTISIALLVLRRGAIKRDPVVTAYAKFCRKLARAGFQREPHEGPFDFAQRVISSRADLTEEVMAVTQIYTIVRYAGAKRSSAQLIKLVHDFSPRR